MIFSRKRRWWSILLMIICGNILSVFPVWSAEKTPPTLHPSIGTNTHFCHKTKLMEKYDAEQLMPLIAAAGFGWIRDSILWREVEYEKGKYRIPENTLKWVNIANKYGIKVIAVFESANPTLYSDPYDPEAYAKAAAFVVRELKGKIHCLEILNEPFTPDFQFSMQTGGGSWNGIEKDGEWSPWAKKYYLLMNKAAEAIRAANPEIKIIALPQNPPANFRFLEKGISPVIDGIDEHVYSFRTIPEITPFPATESVLKRDKIAVADATGSFASMIRLYREHSAKHKGPKEIWITEQGYTTYREGGRRALYSGFSEEAQAKYLQRRFMECLGLGVDVMVQFDFMDDGDDLFEAEYRFGLIRANHEKKPSFQAMKNLNAATLSFVRSDLKGVKIFPFSDRKESRPVSWDGNVLSLPGLIRAYEFQDVGRNKVIALWSAESLSDLQVRSADVEIDVDPGKFFIEVYDLMNGEIYRPEFKNKAGRIMIEKLAVPDYPILVTIKPN